MDGDLADFSSSHMGDTHKRGAVIAQYNLQKLGRNFTEISFIFFNWRVFKPSTEA